MLTRRNVRRREISVFCYPTVHWFVVAALATISAVVLTTNASAQSQTVEFDIPAQPVTSALRSYARQAGVNVLVVSEVLNSIQANPVVGSFEPENALRVLLAGTGLHAEYRPDATVAVGRASDVSVQPVGSISSDSEALSSLVAQASVGVEEQMLDEETSQAERDTERGTTDDAVSREVEEILVTGSRIRGAQNASPVVTITRQEIDRAGFATVEELVDKLPQNFGAGASLDNSTDAAANVSTVVGGVVFANPGSTSVNLRGLGTSSTLILLNGRRLSPSGSSAAFTNISSIPITAIERIDVLTDGASAIYGSDAIGGVINFILRDNYEGAETRLRYGLANGGDKPEVLFGQSLGKSWDDGNVLLTYEYYDSDNLASSDRDITSTNDLSRFGGTDWRAFGGNPANIQVVLADGSSQTFAIPTGQDGTSLTAADFDPDAPLNSHNSRSLQDVMPALERHSAFLHLTQEIGTAELFGAVNFSTQDAITRNGAEIRSFTVTDSNPFFVDPTNTGLTTVRVENYSFDDDLGASLGFSDIDSLGGTLGVRFDIAENWNSELVGNWSREKTRILTSSRFDADALTSALNQTDPDLAFNPFGDGSNTNPAVLQSFIDNSRSVSNPNRNELWQLNLNVNGEAFDVPGGAVQVATGIEFRDESLFVNNTFRDTISDLSREILAVYAEVFLPLVSNSNSRPGLRRLELSLAGRYEDYNDFGGSTNPKIGLVWSPTQSLMLRGTYGTSFQAPSLVDLDITGNNARYFPQFFVDLGLIPFPFILHLGGNENLKAEEATTWTTGFQWNSSRVNGLSLDVTYFNIDFKDRVDNPTSNILEAINDPRFATTFNTNPTAEQILELVDNPNWRETNAAGGTTTLDDILSGDAPVGGILDLRETNLSRMVVTGAELQLSYNFDTAVGSFGMGLNGSYLFDFERQFIAADPLVDEVDQIGRPVDLRVRGNFSWSHAGWNISTFANYTDGYTDNVHNTEPRSVDSWTTIDVSVSYDTGYDNGFFSDTRLSLTTQNLLDEDPPFVNTLGGLAYDSVNGNPLGRFTAIQITKDW